MTFVWPTMLLALLALPVLTVTYAAVQRRRARSNAALASTGLVMTGAGRQLGRKRHVPFVLFLAAVAVMLVALARPQAAFAIPRQSGTVILVFDVSNSMLADDIEPTRIGAAKTAARAFVDAQPNSIEIGVVAFGDGALVTQAPTTDQAAVLAAIERLKPAGGTSISQGILSALSSIAGEPITVDERDAESPGPAQEIGYFGYATILLLSDGENTSGSDPLKFADLAASAGVHISTIGLGSEQGATIEADGYQIATTLDDALLTDIADSTGGTYYRAEDADALDQIYRSIDLRNTTEAEPTELTAPFAAVAIVLMIAGGIMMMRWFGRII